MKTQTEGQIGLTKTTTHLGKIGKRETETTIGTITTIIKQRITITEAIMTKMNQGTTIIGTNTTKTGRGATTKGTIGETIKHNHHHLN